MMNEMQIKRLNYVQEMVGSIIRNMEKDPYHAPADWVLEMIWNEIEQIKEGV